MEPVSPAVEIQTGFRIPGRAARHRPWVARMALEYPSHDAPGIEVIRPLRVVVHVELPDELRHASQANRYTRRHGGARRLCGQRQADQHQERNPVNTRSTDWK